MRNMTWGHATSPDLLHWQQQPNKLFPKTMAVRDCFSGGATVDKHNTAGWGDDTLVAFFIDTGAGECIAYSTDGRDTFTYYEGHTSTNLREWTFRSRLIGYYECPELYELPVDGDESNTRWVTFGAGARYVLGSFNGTVFTPDHEWKPVTAGNWNSRAAKGDFAQGAAISTSKKGIWRCRYEWLMPDPPRGQSNV